MPRYAPALSTDALHQLLVDMAKQHDYEENYGPITTSPDMERITMMLLSDGHLPIVEKDWAKIDFSTENLLLKTTDTTPDGIAYLDLRVGGDWETPLQAIVYFDGKTMRGYIPKTGNTYNHKTKAAFGNDDTDGAQAKTQLGWNGDPEYIEAEPDTTQTRADIAKRLAVRGTYTPSQKPIVSNATQKAQRQQQIESTQDLSGPITKDMVYAVINLAAGSSYVEFELRSSRRRLTVDEANRLEGVPPQLEKKTAFGDDTLLWYAPMGCYPMSTLALLENAGFEKAPDNDLSAYKDAKTVVIYI